MEQGWSEQLLTLEHLGWDAIPERPGSSLLPFHSRLAEWWRDQLGALGAEAGRAG